jgi:hypothetical protein
MCHFVDQNKQGYRVKTLLTSGYMARVIVQIWGYKIKEVDPSLTVLVFNVEMF